MLLEVDDMRKAVNKAIDAAKLKAEENIEEITQDAIALLENNRVEKKKYKMTFKVVLDIDAAQNRTINPTGSVGWESVTKSASFEGQQVPMTGDYDPCQGKLDLYGPGESDTSITVQDGMTEPPEDYDGPRPK